ncbi:MAG: hypothetical protein M3Z24_01070, partial [Chloroflexota bacterium]|nr:hypothetical protein [Chloroflexota bacterium]
MHTRELLLANRQPQTTIGVLTERELLLHDIFADGKRTLRSLLLPLDAAEPGELLAFLWQAELNMVWVMPTTRWSQTMTDTWFRSVESQWTVIVRSASQEPDRPLSVLLWPKGNSRPTARQLVLAFPEQARWGWQLADATSLLATVTYLERVLARSVSDGPELLAHQLLTDLTANSSSTPWRRSPPMERAHCDEPADAAIPPEEQMCHLAW